MLDRDPIGFVRQELSTWELIQLSERDFGKTEVTLFAQEIAQIHRNGEIHVALPTRLVEQLLAERKAAPSDRLPQGHWVSHRIYAGADVFQALWLLSLGYHYWVFRQQNIRPHTPGQAIEALKPLAITETMAQCFCDSLGATHDRVLHDLATIAIARAYPPKTE